MIDESRFKHRIASKRKVGIRSCSEFRHVKFDIPGYALIILKKSTFSERLCIPYRNRGFRAR